MSRIWSVNYLPGLCIRRTPYVTDSDLLHSFPITPPTLRNLVDSQGHLIIDPEKELVICEIIARRMEISDHP